MAFSDPQADLRHIQRRRREILTTVLRLGHQLDLALPDGHKITPALRLLAQEPFTPSTAPLPSLDDFVDAQGLDPDLYSESELLEIFKEHYGIDHTPPQDQPPRLNAQIRALNQVSALLAQAPSPGDRVDRWLAPALAARLKAAGIPTLARLVDVVNLQGYRWYRSVPRLGEVRARALVQWLNAVVVDDDAFAIKLRPTVLVPPQRQHARHQTAIRDVVLPRRFGLVPLEALLVPPALRGAQGRFRSNMPNTLGADDDLQAMEHWLRKYQERPHTWRAYKREIERFYLWCLHECGKPLSSIDALDCQAYRQFLARLPATWVQPRPCGGVPLPDRVWRPFRGDLSPASQKQALVIVQALFEGLQQAGYLVANPMAAVMKGFNLPNAAIHIDRSFTDAEWRFVWAALEQDPPGPARTRLRLLLALLASTGLRLDEVATAGLSALRQVPVDGEAQPAWVLQVTGKRRKVREVPLAPEVVALVIEHAKDAGATVGTAGPAAAPSPVVEGTSPPLIHTLAPRVPVWQIAADGSEQARLSGRPQLPGGLSHRGIYAVLKRYFQRIARQAGAHGLDPTRLESASTHWLRHTFGRQALAAQVPIEVVQQTLGHASLNTTTIYVTTERSRMIKELRKLRPALPVEADQP